MMDAQDIGAILRAAREAKGISIASAAMQTRLSIDILEKLEANRFSEIARLSDALQSFFGARCGCDGSRFQPIGL